MDFRELQKNFQIVLRGEYHGQLEDEDRTAIFDLLEHTKTITTSEKKRFGIKRM